MSSSPENKRTSSEAKQTKTQQMYESARLRSEQALRLVCANIPWLSGLAYTVTLHVDDRVGVAAVTETGRVLVNPKVFSEMPLPDLLFVMAHELMHLVLDTFGRTSKFDDHEQVNWAHDYIINDFLRKELHCSPPLNGLDHPGASENSLEQMMAWMNKNKWQQPTTCWKSYGCEATRSTAGQALSQALRDAGILPPVDTPRVGSADDISWQLESMDVISQELERKLYPESESKQGKEITLSRRIDEVRRAAIKSLSLKECNVAIEKQIQQSNRDQLDHSMVEALRDCYHTPWQVALQRWMEAVAPGQRSYARPSRRGAGSSDCVLPGRAREGWTLHLVLDTSGSMSDELCRALGAVAEFSESAGVADVHILQCDVEVTVDEWVPIEQLDSYRIAGYGGSDMSPAMQRLADDPEICAVVVITDGYIDFPTESPPYHVLWVLTDRYNFEPPYGEVLVLSHR